jgi:hypothetical protein
MKNQIHQWLFMLNADDLKGSCVGMITILNKGQDAFMNQFRRIFNTDINIRY